MTSISYKVVNLFEKTIADYAGSKYAVAVESCCAAIFLCLEYLSPDEVILPSRTYPGVACSVIHSGSKLLFNDYKWNGEYDLLNTGIIDSALRFKKGMHINNTMRCLSFHAKKLLPIGRGGMILTDDKDAYEWFKKARFDGRSTKPLNEDKIDMVGWNFYMTPEQAARGLMLFDLIKDKDLPDLDVESQNYPDLSKIDAYK